jgi:transcriptional regulator with XRE-family HTH domain
MADRVVTPDQVIGASVRRLRESSGWTQADLGTELAIRGWGSSLQSAVAALERGRKRLGWAECIVLADVFRVSAQSLMTLSWPASSTRVRVGERDLTSDEWYERMRVTDEDRAVLRQAARRPPAGEPRHRRVARQFQQIVLSQREEQLKQRAKFPGPTFVADRPMAIPFSLPRWGTRAVIHLRPGAPYVARDRLEADALLAAEGEGRVRRIDRHTARRLRTKKGVEP